jgi:hypothetical protein
LPPENLVGPVDDENRPPEAAVLFERVPELHGQFTDCPPAATTKLPNDELPPAVPELLLGPPAPTVTV